VTGLTAPRRERLARLGSAHFDIHVIGGGITGSGVALDAAARGLSVALVEQGDFAEGTSSRSTKLVHGGLRYLPMLDIPQVREDLEERGRLLRNAPHLVRPLPFVLPLYGSARRPLGLRLPSPLRPFLPLGLAWGLWAYDILAGRERMRPHRRLTRDEARALVPPLRLGGLRAAYLYYDAATDDARLTISVLRTAVGRGALAVNYVRAVDIITDQGRATGVRLLDVLSQQSLTASARTIVNATGVWAESVAGLTGRPSFRIRRAKGVHVVVSRGSVGVRRTALVLPETDDGRLAFVVPWQGAVLIGTTDTEWDGPPGNPSADESDVAYLLEHASRFLDVRLTRRDVLGTYAGLRPLVSAVRPHGGSSAELSRRHAIFPAGGVVTIAGGKLTTYRRMAEDVMNLVVGRPPGSPSPTRGLCLDSAQGLAAAVPGLRTRARALGLSRRTFVHLIRTYGTETATILDLIGGRPALGQVLTPDHPHIAAEVVVAVRDEMAVTVADVLMRRTRLAHLLPRQGVEIAPRVAALVAEELGWSRDMERQAVEEYGHAAAVLAAPGDAARSRA
jgi:glycerol-3-phosphate dehydrogenase